MGEISKHDQDEPIKESEERKVQIVAVEQLIPDIKTPATEKVEGVDHRTNKFNDQFVPDIVRGMDMSLTMPERLSALRERFKDKVVVDLGAGDMSWAYFLSVALGSKGYVGVEKFQGDRLEDTLKHNDAKTMLWYWANISRSSSLDKISLQDDPEFKKEYEPFCKLIPAAVAKEDILDFLKRLPDDSVNVLTFGVDDMVLPSSQYRSAVAKEIERVLNSDGMYITDSSSIILKNDESFSDELPKDKSDITHWFNYNFNKRKFRVKK